MNKKLAPLAVVTGASSGIGLELAKQFASHGYDLLIAAEDSGIDAVVPSLEAFGNRVTAIRVDLASEDGNESLYKRIHAMGRPVEALALNAGVGVHGHFVRDTDFDDHYNLINLNIVSPVYLAHRIGADMLNAGRGRILFTSSVASLMPGTYMATYNASKAFIESFAEAIRAELKDSGVSVTTLLPNATETNFFIRAGMEDTLVGAGPKDSAFEVAKDGFQALMDGKDHVVGGPFKNAVQVAVSKVLPDTVKAEMHRKQAEPHSAKHN